MITKLNLATRPFRNRLLPYLFSALLLVASVFGGVYCLVKLKENRDRNQLLVSAIVEHRDEVQSLKGKGEQVQQLLTPEQRALLAASHKLVANKSFGWSRLFADLEGVLPGSVSASRISVENIYQDADRIKAELELGVLARDYASVEQMIQRMSNSGLFLAELRGQDLQKKETVTYTEYTFRVIYTPTYSYSSTPVTETAQNVTGGGAAQ